MNQQTIKEAFTLSGHGIHTAEPSTVTVHPGEVGSGLRLRLGGTERPLTPVYADGSKQRTVIRHGDRQVHTIEHLLAVLAGMRVDNAVIEMDGAELPAFDGSAHVYAQKVAEVGLVEQEAEAKTFRLKEPICVGRDGACITATPSKDGLLCITFMLDFPESRHARGVINMHVSPEGMLHELSPARTFVMKAHADALREQGLGKGATTANTLVLDGDTVVENELRFPDECLRHKVMDLVGDLALVGRRLSMHILARQSGHALNVEFARRIRLAALAAENPLGLMSARDIENKLPHRYPFGLVDRVLDKEDQQYCLALKNVTRNEPFFNGHFPGQPIMPGVLQIEALAQTAGLAFFLDDDKLGVLMGVDNVKWRKPVLPGDTLLMEAHRVKFNGRIGVVDAQATVEGDLACSATIKFALVDKKDFT